MSLVPPLDLPLKSISTAQKLFVGSCARKRGCTVERAGALFTTFTVYYIFLNGN